MMGTGIVGVGTVSLRSQFADERMPRTTTMLRTVDLVLSVNSSQGRRRG